MIQFSLATVSPYLWLYMLGMRYATLIIGYHIMDENYVAPRLISKLTGRNNLLVDGYVKNSLICFPVLRRMFVKSGKCPFWSRLVLRSPGLRQPSVMLFDNLPSCRSKRQLKILKSIILLFSSALTIFCFLAFIQEQKSLSLLHPIHR